MFFICARNYVKHITYIISLNPLNNSVRWGLAKFTEPFRGRDSISPRQPDSRTRLLTIILHLRVERKLLEKSLNIGTLWVSPCIFQYVSWVLPAVPSLSKQEATRKKFFVSSSHAFKHTYQSCLNTVGIGKSPLLSRAWGPSLCGRTKLSLSDSENHTEEAWVTYLQELTEGSPEWAVLAWSSELPSAAHRQGRAQ